MKVSYKQHAKEKSADNCVITEHHVDEEKMIDCAVVELNGRYPNTGWVINQQCKELGYVRSGKGQIVIEDKTFPLSAGDVVLIQPGEKYFWHGEMSIVISCTPSWHPEQHLQVE